MANQSEDGVLVGDAPLAVNNTVVQRKVPKVGSMMIEQGDITTKSFCINAKMAGVGRDPYSTIQSVNSTKMMVQSKLTEELATTTVDHMTDLQHHAKCAKMHHEILTTTSQLGAWNPALHIFSMQAPRMMGASRCIQLSMVCPSSAEGVHTSMALHSPFLGQRLDALGESETKRCVCSLLLQAVGAPTFSLQSILTAEDDVYLLLANKTISKWIPDMLASHSSITDYKDINNMIACLQPKCKLPESILQILFGPQIERSKTLFLSPQPLHYAIIHSSAWLTNILLAAAASVGLLDRALGKVQSIDTPATLSPLFFTVLFGERDVANVLKSAGAVLNNLDVLAAMRLQRVKLWDTFIARMEALELNDAATQLSIEVQKAKQKIANNRAAMKTLICQDRNRTNTA